MRHGVINAALALLSTVSVATVVGTAYTGVSHGTAASWYGAPSFIGMSLPSSESLTLTIFNQRNYSYTLVPI